MKKMNKAKVISSLDTSELTKKVFLKLCKENGLPEPYPEYLFAKAIGRQWRIDYFITDGEIKIALEVEGGIRTGGRHIRPEGFLGDMEKYNHLSMFGIYLIRVQPNKLNTLSTIEMIKSVLSRKHWA